MARSGGESELELGDPGREAMPPGHPVAWSVLVEGTSLAGTIWPGWGDADWNASASKHV